MPSPFVLLKCIGKAVLKNALHILGGGVPGLDGLLGVAKDAMSEWKEHKAEQERRAELQAVAQAAAQDFRRQVAEVVADLAADQPEQIRQALADYLMQLPAVVRQSLRRPADPVGVTVPAQLSLRQAEDLVPFLPIRLPRFHRGDRPSGIGDWELLELLGLGGFGEVWKARNPHMPADAPVALKFCLDPETAAALGNEAALLARVRREGKHPGIVELRHTYLSADPPCLEYEYVEGGDLAGLIQERHQLQGGIEAPEAARIMRTLAGILGFTHQLQPPLVHRDLKPANILVQGTMPGAMEFKIADFGIGGLATLPDLARGTRVASARGQILATVARGSYTPLYASPQQARGDNPDPRDDVYSLGVIWYQLVTGDLTQGVPSGVRWLSELKQRGMSEAQVELLASCVEDRPSDRPASAAVLAGQLAPLLEVPKPLVIATPVFPPPAASPAAAVPEPAQRALPVRTEEAPRPAETRTRHDSALADTEARERAADAVFWPALWLLHIGGLICLGVAILLLILPMADAYRYWGNSWILLFQFAAAVVFVLGIVILRAGIHLMTLRSYSVALVGSVLMIYLGVLTLPLVGGILLLPGGIWATCVLRRRDIKSAFAMRGEERDLSPAEAEKRQRAEDAVFWPALWLVHIGGLICLGVPIALLILPMAEAYRYWGNGWILLFHFGAAAVFVLGMVILRAGIHLVKLQSYTVALVGSIVMIYVGVLTLPFVGGILFLPGGIWATRVVRRRDIKAAFGR
jgi:hypothetical protein